MSIYRLIQNVQAGVVSESPLKCWSVKFLAVQSFISVLGVCFYAVSDWRIDQRRVSRGGPSPNRTPAAWCVLRHAAPSLVWINPGKAFHKSTLGKRFAPSKRAERPKGNDVSALKYAITAGARRSR